jgi:hypothetical protein
MRDLPQTRYMRPESYATSRGISIHTLRHWVRTQTVPSYKIGRMILLDPTKVDAAIGRFERKEITLK